MIRLTFFTLLLLTAGGLRAQNLVPNPSFEEKAQCPANVSDFCGYVDSWFQPTPGTADYFNSCAPGGTSTSVPNNFVGFQNARNGIAYSGILCYTNDDVREYIETRLTMPLEADTQYCVEFFVSHGHFHRIAISRIGAYFTQDSLFHSTYYIYGVIPQVANPIDSFLNDTLQWTKISGSFTAQGGEQYLTIGNFYPNSQTPVMGNLQPPLSRAYYYIDDVTVSKCSNFGVGINALVGKEKQLLNAFPNPSTGSLTIDYTYDPGMAYRISVSDLAGRIVYKGMVSAGARMINLSHLTDGAYLVQLSKNDRVVGHSKLILLK